MKLRNLVGLTALATLACTQAEAAPSDPAPPPMDETPAETAEMDEGLITLHEEGSPFIAFNIWV